ncbi:MAG: rod shape-determining protein MreC [Alkalicoccus sp.]|nr:MAG: rod shape-determining protein MreC [Alkalicoccus sp.]
MNPFFSNRRLIVLLVCLIFLVGLIGYSLSEQRTLSWPEQFVQDSVGVVQSAFSRPAYWVSNSLDAVGDIRDVYRENQVLKSQLEEHASVLVERNQLEERNAELEEALELESDLSDYTSHQAMVIQRSPDRWNERIGLNVGAQDGITEDMAVVTSAGLVGKIREVSQFTSTVQLLSDQDASNRISARTDGEDTAFGFMEGIDEESGHLRFTKIDMEIEVEEGDIVSTSGLGGIFPSGITIGEIVSVQSDEYGLSQTALVEPSADSHQLDYVTVLDREAPGGEDNSEEEEEEEE